MAFLHQVLCGVLLLVGMTIPAAAFQASVGLVKATAIAVDDATALYSTTNEHAAMGRKSFLQFAGLSALSVVVTAPPAHADVTNKVASSAALRNVKLVQKKFAGLEEVVGANEYTELRESLRAAPISDIRKNMSTLVKGGEDGPDAQVLQDEYKSFIACLERMDITANGALRGKKLDDGEFMSTYRATVDALDTFLETAQGASEIPVQYNE